MAKIVQNFNIFQWFFDRHLIERYNLVSLYSRSNVEAELKSLLTTFTVQRGPMWMLKENLKA